MACFLFGCALSLSLSFSFFLSFSFSSSRRVCLWPPHAVHRRQSQTNRRSQNRGNLKQGPPYRKSVSLASTHCVQKISALPFPHSTGSRLTLRKCYARRHICTRPIFLSIYRLTLRTCCACHEICTCPCMAAKYCACRAACTSGR